MTEIKYKDTTIPVEAGQTVTLNTADKKLTGDIEVTAPKAESGGGGADRDYWVVCFTAIASGTSWTNFSYKLSSAPNTTVFRPHSTGGGEHWVKVPKGDQISFNFKFNSGFKYVKSATLGLNHTTPNTDTPFVSVTQDVFDMEAYAFVEMTSG